MQKTYKIALLGNRAMAIRIGEILNDDPRVELLVVLNPDDDGIDRGDALSLKLRAETWSCDIYQPKGLKTFKQIEPLASFCPDVILSCSYARIIPAHVIDLPTIASLNIHFADLPKNRGCLPVVWTMAQQEKHLTACLHLINPGIDDGDIILKKQTPLAAGITAQQATMQCVELGVAAFLEYWQALKAGTVMPATVQDEALITYHTMKFPYDRYVPWHKHAAEVAAVINSLTFPPHPAARSLFSKASPVAGEWTIAGPAFVVQAPAQNKKPGTIEPGTIKKGEDGRFIVHCGRNSAIQCQSILPNDEICDVVALEARLGNHEALVFNVYERPIYQT